MTRIKTIALIVWLEMLRRKDIYVLLSLMAILLFALLSVNIFGLGGVAGYVKDIGLLVTWVFSWILAVVVSARELPEEEKQGTIYPLLAKPITRAELIIGKWLGSWTIVSLATFCFYGVVLAVVYLRASTMPIFTLLQGYAFHIFALSIICAVALALSTRMNFDAAATFSFAVTGGAFLILPRVPDLMALETGLRRFGLLVVYYALPHFELFDMRQRLVHGEAPVAAAIAVKVVLYGILMTAAFLSIAWLSYRRKRFVRGDSM